MSKHEALTPQERHFADQIDGLLKRVNLLENFLGGRWVVADRARCTPETIVRSLASKKLLRRLIKRIPSSVTPDTCVSVHPSELLDLAEAVGISEIDESTFAAKVEMNSLYGPFGANCVEDARLAPDTKTVMSAVANIRAGLGLISIMEQWRDGDLHRSSDLLVMMDDYLLRTIDSRLKGLGLLKEGDV